MSELQTIFYSKDFDKKVSEGKKKAETIVRIFELIEAFKYYYDQNIKAAMDFGWHPNTSSHFKIQASWNKKHIERLKNCLSVTAPDIHL